MRTLFGLEQMTPAAQECVLAVGNFDGVHRAHQALLSQARARAEAQGSLTAVLTFEPHPLTVVAPQRAPQRLTPLDEKLRLLELHGADLTVVARSEPALLRLDAEAFIRDVIVERFSPRLMVEGPTFGFGRGRRGDNRLLAQAGERYGFGVVVVEPVSVAAPGGEQRLVSSSLVRDALRAGDVACAAACLGRPYALLGAVIRGQGRGRQLGFATANLDCADQMIPAEGVYAGKACWDTQCRPAAISIGTTPTFGGRAVLVEAHLLGGEAELYDRRLRLELTARLRDQKTFVSAEELKLQIARDVDAVRSRGDSP